MLIRLHISQDFFSGSPETSYSELEVTMAFNGEPVRGLNLIRMFKSLISVSISNARSRRNRPNSTIRNTLVARGSKFISPPA